MRNNLVDLLRKKVKEGIFKATAKSLNYSLDYDGENEGAYLPRHNGPWYLSPQDLGNAKLEIKSVLVLGSCLSEELVHIWSVAGGEEGSIKFDFRLMNHIGELPDDIPHDEYDFHVVQLPLQDLMSDFTYFRLVLDNPEELPEFFEATATKMELALEGALKWAHMDQTHVFILGLLPPQVNPLGRFQPKYDLTNLKYFVESLNRRMYDLSEMYPYVHYVDLDEFVSVFGKKHFQDDMVWQSTHGSFLTFADHEGDRHRIAPLESMDKHYTMMYPQLMTWLWSELVSMYRTIKGTDQVKVVAVDLDDTVWRGVAADGQTFDAYGWPVGFAEALLWVKKRGILLATVSKNEESTIRELWDTLTEGRLRWDDFVVHFINFAPKVENLAKLAETLNVGLDGIIFIDDNPVEREQVKLVLPEVRVIGQDPLHLKRILLWSAETQRSILTKEATSKTLMVRAQIERERDRKVMDRSAFLESLELEVDMERVHDTSNPDIQRVLELFNKTNQVNTMATRYTQSDLFNLIRDEHVVDVFRVRDKYTEYGLVSVVLSKGNTIRHFVMSCRVMGLGVEQAILFSTLESNNVDPARSKISVVETDRNKPVRDILGILGWASQVGSNEWELSVGATLSVPSHIRIRKREGVK